MFYSNKHMLVGLHASSRRHVRICGFGGKREGEEPWWQTAFRETVEELLEPEHISFNLYHALASNIMPRRLLYDARSAYLVLVYTTEDLKRFLAICAEFVTTSLYRVFPRSAEDLVFHRIGRDAEISDIVFWPMTNRHRVFQVTRDLIHDMESIESME